jgi:hypothetical protein
MTFRIQEIQELTVMYYKAQMNVNYQNRTRGLKLNNHGLIQSLWIRHHNDEALPCRDRDGRHCHPYHSHSNHVQER